jgi:CO/xanthine dehydrogenase FAD-binding subunit
MAEKIFHRVSKAQEACELLTHYGGKAHILAGGTDLMSKANRRLIDPEVLIYIGDSGLDYIRKDGDSVVIGATTSFTKIIGSPLVGEKTPLLAEAAKHIGSIAIRNMGTIGGNLANGSPAADSATALLAMGARLKLIFPKGERTVESETFFIGPGKTILQSNELLQEVIVPFQGERSKWAYYKLGRRQANTLSVVSAAICMQMSNRTCQGLRIALGAVAPVPMLVRKASALMEGKPPDSEQIGKVASAAAGEINPIDDVRATAWYRRRACEALVRRLLTQLLVV